MTLEERIDRLERFAQSLDEWESFKQLEYRKGRVKEFKQQGLSNKDAKNKAWGERQ